MHTTDREFPRSQLPLDNETEILRRINTLAISPSERRILAALRHRQTLAQGAEEFAVSRDELAAEARCNPGSVSEACQRLQARGLVIITRTGRQSAFRPDWLAVFEGRTRPLASAAATYRKSIDLPALNQLELPFRAIQGGVEVCYGIWKLILTPTGLRIEQTAAADISPEISLPAEISLPISAPSNPISAQQQPEIAPTSAVVRSQQPDIRPLSAVGSSADPRSARDRPSAAHDHEHDLNAMNEREERRDEGSPGKRTADRGSWELNIDPTELRTAQGVETVFRRYQAAGVVSIEDRDEFHQFVRACKRRSGGQSLPGEEPIRRSLCGFIRKSLVKGQWRRGIRDVDRQWYAEQIRLRDQCQGVPTP